MPSFAAVLCLGNDAALLQTRCQVLATRFASVTGRRPDALPTVLGHPCDLLVLCHSLHQQQCFHAIELIRTHHPDAAILAVQTNTKGCHADTVDACVRALDGPLAMFRAIERIHHDGSPRFARL